MDRPGGGPHTEIMTYPELEGKTAIVTGASRGIGVGIAQVLAEQGMKLVLAARTQEAGESLRDKLAGRGAEVVWVTADLTDTDAAARVFEACREAPYLLVNNAAILTPKPTKSILEFDEAEFTSSLLANLKILHHLTFLTARRMKEEGSGVIVNISSVGAQRAHRGLAGYDTYKGAMDSFTRSAAIDLAKYGIRVNGIAPGAIGSRKDPTVAEGIPLGRLGRAEEIGAAVAFLASEGAAYIIGQTITVDGGLVAQLTPPGIWI